MATIPAAERFDLGRVVERASGAIRRNLTLFALLALILQFLPALLIRGFTPAVPVVPGVFPSIGAPLIFGGLLSLALYFVMQAAVTHVTVVDLKGDKATLAPALQRGFRLILPLLGLALVTGFGVMLGMFLLIVPGIILAMMWSVATPVMVEEGSGVFASLGRSGVLTKGSRWRIFLLYLALSIGFFVLTFAVAAVFGTTSAASGAGYASAAASMSGFGVGYFVLAVVNAVFVVAITAMVAAMYVELRFVREGVGPEGLAAIFD